RASTPLVFQFSLQLPNPIAQAGRFLKLLGLDAPGKFLLEPLDLPMDLQPSAGSLRNLPPMGSVPVDPAELGIQPILEGPATIHASKTTHHGKLPVGQTARRTAKSGGLNPCRPDPQGEAGMEQTRQRILKAESGVQTGKFLPF